LASFGFKFGNKHEKTTTPIREKKQQQAVTRAKQKVRIIVLCGLCLFLLQVFIAFTKH